MKNKLSTMALSILIAFALWGYVITTVSPGYEDTFYNVPLVKEGMGVLEERNLIITYQSDENVDIAVSGNRTDVNKINSNNITAKLDVSRIDEPGTMIPLTYNVSYPGDVPVGAVTTQSKVPGTIYFTVEERREKQIPVEVVWIGSTPDGFMSDRENRVLDYEEITVIGPASVADLIEKAVIEVDLNEQRESIEQSYRYTLCDAEGNPVDAQMIKTNTEEVHLEVRIRRIQEINLTVDVVYGAGCTRENTEITLDTQSIRVSGSEAALEALGDTITVGRINLADIPKPQGVTFAITLPEGVTNETGINEVTVDVKFFGLVTKEFDISDIRCVNVPAGARVDLVTEKLRVVFRGPAAELVKLDEKNLYAVADLSNAVLGESSTFVAEIVIAGVDVKAGVLGTYTILASCEEI